MAAIGRVEDAVAIINGDAGTIVTPAGDYGGPGDLRPRRRPQLVTAAVWRMPE